MRAAGAAPALDPIQLALVQARLDHIARQMGFVMIRTSRSPIFNQSHDFSCFITDAAGTLVSQADGIPIHTGGGGFAVRALLRVFAGNIAPGDAFLLSDPYAAGGNHLPDWVIARPVFAAGKIVAFACNRAHQSDIGGGAAGTYNPQATEIFHEGIRLPPLRLIEAGAIREDLWQLLLLNSRCPDLIDGDLRAMLGATHIGAEQVAELANDLGEAGVVTYFEGILAHADRCLRAALAALPDGVYRAGEQFDNDCFVDRVIPLVLTLTKQGGTLTVDFTGTAPQIRGFKNSSLANTYSAVYAGIASFFDADLPRNEGTFRSVEVIAPEGTVVNAKAPAPVTMCTVFPAQEIMHMIWKALGQADPARAAAGWGKNAFPVTSGRDEAGDIWVMYNWGGNAGAGAVAGRDGFNQMGPMVTLGGLVLPNAETYEQLYPINIRRQELRRDGGGPGQWRGGTGIDVRSGSRDGGRVFIPRRRPWPTDRHRRRRRRRRYRFECRVRPRRRHGRPSAVVRAAAGGPGSTAHPFGRRRRFRRSARASGGERRARRARRTRLHRRGRRRLRRRDDAGRQWRRSAGDGGAARGAARGAAARVIGRRA